MSKYNVKVCTFETDEDKPIMKILIFNFDTIKEIGEFKNRIIEAHQQVVNNPDSQIETVSIIASG